MKKDKKGKENKKVKKGGERSGEKSGREEMVAGRDSRQRQKSEKKY